MSAGSEIVHKARLEAQAIIEEAQQQARTLLEAAEQQRLQLDDPGQVRATARELASNLERSIELLGRILDQVRAFAEED